MTTLSALTFQECSFLFFLLVFCSQAANKNVSCLSNIICCLIPHRLVHKKMWQHKTPCESLRLSVYFMEIHDHILTAAQNYSFYFYCHGIPANSEIQKIGTNHQEIFKHRNIPRFPIQYYRQICTEIGTHGLNGNFLFPQIGIFLFNRKSWQVHVCNGWYDIITSSHVKFTLSNILM